MAMLRSTPHSYIAENFLVKWRLVPAENLFPEDTGHQLDNEIRSLIVYIERWIELHNVQGRHRPQS